MVTIIPAILATTEEDFAKELEKIKSSADLEGGWVHIDFMDGELVETKSIDLETLKKFDIPFKKEAHLMVKKPWRWVYELKQQGFERVVIHIEGDDQRGIEDTLATIEDSEMEAGLAINPETDLAQVKHHLNNIDVLQIMSIHPGKQGQPFLESTYDRVREASRLFDIVEVDGGVDDQTAPKLIEVGAQRLVIGSYLQKGDIDESLEKIWEVTQ